MSVQHDFQRWLSTATRGLPAPIKAMIAEELAAHYEDAFAEQCSLGFLPIDAHRAALAQLGSPRATHRALCAVHLARRRFLRAALVTMISLFFLVIGAFFAFQPLAFTMFGIAFGCYILESLRTLLDVPGPKKHAAVAITTIEIGLLSSAVVGSLGMLGGYSFPVMVVFIDPLVLTQLGPSLQMVSVVHVLLAMSIVATGVGWLILSDTLGQHAGLPFRRLLYASLVVNGLGLIGVGAGVLMSNPGVIIPMALVMTIAGLARQAILILIFVRAARQSSDIPWRGSHA
ncbi:MAG: hypothetical protein IT320_13380 [Anaerolineae bacterium]|nr:hypothetical protein [Anaerolineae bacterium]